MGQTEQAVATKPRPTKKVARKNVQQDLVQKALRTGTNLPPAACIPTLQALASRADKATGRNIFVAKATLAKQTKRSERAVQYHLQPLLDGGWVRLQEGGPDPGTATRNYWRLRPNQDPKDRTKPNPNPKHLIPVYRLDLDVFYQQAENDTTPAPQRAYPVKYDRSSQREFSLIGLVQGEPFRGAEIARLKPGNRGAELPPTRGAESDNSGEKAASPNHPGIEVLRTSLPVTDASSLREVASPEELTPHHLKRGGIALSVELSDQAAAPGEEDPDDDLPFTPPTTQELSRAMNEALLILGHEPARYTAYDYAARNALAKLSEDGTCCLTCALIVPYWVASNDDALKGMNQRKNLKHLWGEQHAYYLGRAFDDNVLCAWGKGHDLLDRCEANIFKGTSRSEDELLSISFWCRTCKRRAESEEAEERRWARRRRQGLPV